MEKDLHKRLEEAAEKESKCIDCNSIDKRGFGLCKLYCASYRKFYAGAEYGYKEAIAQAKEWLIEHINTDMECDENGEPLAISYIEGRKLAIEMATEFEAKMNKFWEEKK